MAYYKNSEKETISKILRNHNINSFWHFTEIRNLSYIKEKKGLLSKQNLEKEKLIDKIILGGSKESLELDKKIGNWDKISLSFTPHTPMSFYKKLEKHLVFIEISSEVATFDGVYFTDRNATRTRDGQMRDQGVKGLKNVRFEYINCLPRYDDKDWKKYVQAEVLVPNYIPIKYFKKIHFVSKASLELGKYYWGEDSKLFNIDPNIFSDYDNFSKGWTIKFPYLEDVIFTHQMINNENIQNVSRNCYNVEKIEKGRTFYIITYIFAKNGTKGKILLKKTEEYTFKEETTVFNEEFFWWWYPNFEIYNYYSSNSFIVEIYLNDILWYKTKKEVI